MTGSVTGLVVRLARSQADVEAVQALRYAVFVKEMGADSGLADHAAGLERDRFDPEADHLMVIDRASDRVIGTYRVMRHSQARAVGQFYSETEYDLSLLKGSGHRLLELGRSCLHPAYRGSSALMLLWQGLSEYVRCHDITLLFGVASFPGIDPKPLAQPLSFLHHDHLAPPDLRVRSRNPLRMDVLSREDVDRKRALLEMPALIKAYLRLGAVVGEGAYVDHAFNTIDVCVVMQTDRLTARYKALFDRVMAQ